MVVGMSPEGEARWCQTISSGKITDFCTPGMAERLYTGEVLILDRTHQPPIHRQAAFETRQVLAVTTWVNREQVCLVCVETQDHPTFTPAEKELAQAAVRLIALVLERERLLGERAAAHARALVSEETARKMDEFMGMASHELRTPLTSLNLCVQSAERQLRQVLASPLPQEVGDRLARTYHLAERLTLQVQRMDRLVGDLLDVTRITAGKLEIRLAPCELGSIVREEVEAQQAIWPGRTMTLELQASTSVPLIADADRLGQVVTNYLTNALKYSDDEQPVAVRLVVQEGQARVEVCDHGPGLTLDQQAQVFERFYRVPGMEHRSGSGAGLGLGLYICQTIISRHGGQVGVESAVGQGSTFFFTLPLSGESERRGAIEGPVTTRNGVA
jgi:signal transduction histidine kinase